MIRLTADEARALGVLIEKAMTTPENYPLSLNALTNGANQKSNRDPVLSLPEADCFEAAESLREKGVAVRVDQIGSRVHKYRHAAAELLHARAGELAVLAELLLRGPQTLGELRGRASRMAPMDSLEAAQGYLDALVNRPEPLARQIAPAPGSRAVRYRQLLSDEPAEQPAPGEAPPAPAAVDRMGRLEVEVAELRAELKALRESLGA